MNRRKRSSLGRACTFETLESRALLSANLSASFAGKFPSSIPPTGNTSLSVKVSNIGSAAFKSTATIALYASTDATLDPSDVLLGTKTGKLNLAIGKTSTVAVKLPPPTSVPNGSYILLADVEEGPGPGDVTQATNVGRGPANVQITQAFVDLTDSITKVPAGPIKIVGAKQKATKFSVNVKNSGNVAAKGNVNLSLYLSKDQTWDPADPQIFSGPQSINLAAGKTKALSISANLAATIPSGPRFIIARLNRDNQFSESDKTNDVAASNSTLTIDNPAVPPGPFLISGLRSDVNLVLVGDAELVHFSAQVSESSPSTKVEVDEVDDQGNVISKITDLYDTGNLAVGDSTAADGLFNGLSSIEIDSLGTRRFIAVLTDPSAAKQQSGPLVITAKNAPSDAEIQKDETDSKAVGTKVQQILAGHGSIKSAIKAAQQSIESSGNFIPGSIVASSDAIQWKSSDGCLYLLNLNLFAAANTDGGAGQPSLASDISIVSSAASDSSTDNGGTAISIAPFQSIMVTSGIELAADAADLLQNAGYTVTRKFDANGGLDAFKNLGGYDAIVFHSHGGPLDGGGEAILTSEQTSLLNDLANAWDIYFTNRIIKAVNPDNETEYYAITPDFISAHSGSMDNTIVFGGACDSAFDTAMAYAFLNKGAAAYIGFTGTVNRFVDNTEGIAAFQTLLKEDHNTVSDIPRINTFDDATHPDTLYLLLGDTNATLPHGDLLKDNDLYVNYNWPQSQKDLDSNTNFLGVPVGWHLSSSPYINWSGDDTSAGGTEVSVVDLYAAWQNSQWSNSTTVSVGADWYTPAEGSGPAFITIALKNKTTGKLTHSSSFVVDPGQESSGAQTVLETVAVTLTGNPLNPTVHIAA
jgi:CARDB